VRVAHTGAATPAASVDEDTSLLVLDLDGTIVDKSMRLDPALVRAVRDAIGRGLRVTLATGRMPPSSQPYWEELGITEPVILYNGALVRDPASGDDLFQSALPSGLPWTAFPAYANAPVHPLFFQGDSLYCLEQTLPVTAYCEEQHLVADRIDEPQGFLSTGEFVKCLFIGHPQVLPIVREDLGPLIGGAARLAQSRPDYLEMLPTAASKGTALEWLAQHLGIPIARTIAIGDQENDLEMIHAAGVGVAMAHAPDHVRAAADRVAPPPEAGGLRALLAELLPAYFRD
jgi:Cof subfamily protein (haloacid dehalogenase superfamily)